MIQIKHRYTGALILEVEVLAGANLENAKLENANLENAKLENAKLEGANLEGANLKNANLENAKLAYAKLAGANLAYANLENANLENANLAYAKLAGAKLVGAILVGTNFECAKLVGANLEGANLKNAKLENTNLENTKLGGAIGFRFPDTLDPRELRLLVADQIEKHPELHNQSTWGTGEPDCKTGQCVAGWACSLGGGRRNMTVADAAIRLLWVDGLPMPPFDADASREEILYALRAGQ